MRIPPIFYCDYCEYGIKVKGLREGSKAQFIAKRCSECTKLDQSATTGTDRPGGGHQLKDLP